MVRTFLQVAAGAADIPVTRLLGQSLAGLSATGDSDTRNYYDMIAARQELDLRPQLERLDALLLSAAGIDPGAVRFEFRPPCGDVNLCGPDPVAGRDDGTPVHS